MIYEPRSLIPIPKSTRNEPRYQPATIAPLLVSSQSAKSCTPAGWLSDPITRISSTSSQLTPPSPTPYASSQVPSASPGPWPRSATDLAEWARSLSSPWPTASSPRAPASSRLLRLCDKSLLGCNGSCYAESAGCRCSAWCEWARCVLVSAIWTWSVLCWS